MMPDSSTWTVNVFTFHNLIHDSTLPSFFAFWRDHSSAFRARMLRKIPGFGAVTVLLSLVWYRAIGFPVRPQRWVRVQFERPALVAHRVLELVGAIRFLYSAPTSRCLAAKDSLHRFYETLSLPIQCTDSERAS
jgi:hypothetical protein